MGRDQRSRKKLPSGQVCYLCRRPIEPDEEWDRDHTPMARLFAKAVRSQLNPNLKWLPVHKRCNAAYKADEEYFVTAFAGQVESETATAVMSDLKRGALEGHGRGLIQTIINSFGRVVGPKGEVLFEYDTDRVRRVVWKMIRGLYHLEGGQLLPEQPHGLLVCVISPRDAKRDLAQIPWFELVRDTEPLGKYGDVFDYKWLGWKDGELRGHAFAMLLWNGLIIAALFHDPTCGCGGCAEHAPID